MPQSYRSPITQALLQQALTPPRGPVYSVGQGIANAGTQIVNALIAKKFAKNEALERGASAEAMVSLIAGLNDSLGSPIEQDVGGAKRARIQGQDVVAPGTEIGRAPGPYSDIVNILSGIKDPDVKSSVAQSVLPSVLSRAMGDEGGLISGDAAEALGFRPGTVLQRTKEGYKSLQDSENPEFVTLKRGDEERSFLETDPRVSSMLEQGYTVSRPPASQVTIEQKTEAARSVASTTGEVDRFYKSFVQPIDEEAKTASDAKAKNAQLRSFLQNGLPQGKIADLTLGTRNFLSGLGFNDPTVDAQQAFKAISTDSGLVALQKFKGATSEKELAVAQDTVAKLANTPGGNEMILELNDFSNDLALKKQEMINNYLKETGGVIPAGAQGEVTRRLESAEKYYDRQVSSFIADWNKRAKKLSAPGGDLSEMSDDELTQKARDILKRIQGNQ